MGSVRRRLERLEEERVEQLVEQRVEEELEAVVDLLEEHLTQEEFVRVLRIIAGHEEKGEKERIT